MIDEPEFERRLFVWLDRELPPHEAAEMEAFCAANPKARLRADRERAMNERIVAALLTERDGAGVVARAIASTSSTRPTG